MYLYKTYVKFVLYDNILSPGLTRTESISHEVKCVRGKTVIPWTIN